ncbi:DUF5799 family protein [Halobacterium salinarum]|uniref:Uncharacterized protein n=1 Tax=Halobacterium salinarum (strain ATCC 33171 / DSM 3754 / JCM 8978 / NBRC 102687 / NCIMB 764 / 91-R6) TaxID=2597657 RepID=A0A4D6GUU6_HALS9|nr:DUF5799 family protein [Halobacterium salinarum]QCC44886.1 uncharacterized protein HBSAL_06120 [Halobacterium salinarum]TYO75530.1 hypothetical protein APQ99_01853 [Halobacterium salinarum DSM 3754]
MTDDWQDLIVGARMSVDQQFADRVQASGLSRPQWGLVMTAVEFAFENADDPETARIVADTSSLEHVLPEMDNVDQQMGAMGGGGGGSSGGSGVVGGIKDALGIGGGDDDHEELADESRELAQAYADQLQAHLEDEGRFEEVRRAAASE